MYDVIIIGAGPAGLMAAIEASKNSKTLLIEKNATPGKKLLLTGGGRCNITNLKSTNDFLSELEYNKKYLYSAINKFGPKEIFEFLTSNGVPLKKEKEDQIFPISNKSGDILNALLKNTSKVEFRYNETVLNIINGEIKEIVTDKSKYLTKNIIIATGGSSFKNTGSTGDNMKFASILNQPTVELFPAETGIILEESNSLAGTAIDPVEVKYQKKVTVGNLMFTHKGLSGSAIMKMSEHLYKNEDKQIVIDLLPNITQDNLIDLIIDFDREKELSTFLNTLFSKRFSLYLVNRLNINKKIKALNKKEILEISDLIKACRFTVKGVGSIEEAYVVGGGIDMKNIDSTTMESKHNKGVYFVGEALDIHGPIGGYNLTLALSTGYLAGISISKKMSEENK